MCLQQPSSAVNWPTGIQRAHYISSGKPNSHRNSHRKGYTKSFSAISVNTGIYAEAGVFSTRTLASVKPTKIQFPRFIPNDNQQEKDAHNTLKPLKEFLKCFNIIVLALSLLLLFYTVAAIILVATSTTIPKTVQQQFPENKNYDYHIESFSSFDRFEQLQAQLPAFDSPWLVTLLVGVSPLPEVIRRRCRTTAPSRHILRTIAAAALVLVFAAAALTIAARCCYAAPNNTPLSNLTPHNDSQPQNTLVEISNPRSTSIIITNLIPPPSTASPSFWRSQNRFRRALHQITALPAATKATKPSPNANSDHLLLRKTYNYSYNTKTHNSTASNIPNPNSADDHYSVSVRTLSDQQVLEVVKSARNDRSNSTTNTRRNINNNNIISADDLSRVSVKPFPQDKDSKVVEHPQLSAYNSTTSNRLMPSVHVLQQTGDTVEQPFQHHLQHHPAEDVQLQKENDEASGERGLGAGDGAKGGSGGGGLLALVVSATLLTATLGLITCVVSHYRGGGGGDGGGAPPPPPPPLPGHQLQAAAGQNAGFCVPHTTTSAPVSTFLYFNFFVRNSHIL